MDELVKMTCGFFALRRGCFHNDTFIIPFGGFSDPRAGHYFDMLD
jgi:hypothetical protein